MALKGNKLQGYCLLTIADNKDGTTTETPGTGVITDHVVSFNGAMGTDSSDLYAGDRKDFTDPSNEGDVQFVLSQLPLEDEAAFGGHKYDAENGLVEQEGDTAPYMRYACLGVGARKDENGKQVNFYRLLMYHKVQMGPVDDVLQTKGKTTTWGTHTCAGKCYYNVDGKMRTKKDFDADKYAEAVKAMQTFLNITGD